MDLYQSGIIFIFCLFIAGLFWRIYQMDVYQSGILVDFLPLHWRTILENPPDGRVPVWDICSFSTSSLQGYFGESTRWTCTSLG